jgi:hypothetical protein
MVCAGLGYAAFLLSAHTTSADFVRRNFLAISTQGMRLRRGIGDLVES